MPRPKLYRRIRFCPRATYFKPRAIPLSLLEEVTLHADELEALRLCDAEGISQDDAAKKMGVSQSTIQRILEKGRHKVSDALVKGKAIKIIT